MPLEITTGPTIEPVTLDEAKTHLRIENTADDALIMALIVAAREMAEQFTGRALITQTWTLYLDKFDTEIRTPLPPLQSVAEIKYTDTDGAEQILDPATYIVDTKSKPGRIVSVDGWPDTDTTPNAVAVQFVAGYGSPGQVPETIKAAIRLMVADLYESRESYIVGTTAAPLPTTSETLLWPYKVF